MLLGVDRILRDTISSLGYKLRIYVPYGKNWFAYTYRRFKENPAVLQNIMKGMFVPYKRF